MLNATGGSILCSIDGCKRGVKSRGLCWTHGGGTKKPKTRDDPQSDDGSSTASESYETPPPPPRPKAAAKAAAAVEIETEVALCLFDGCTAAPRGFGVANSSGFCAFHAEEVTQENYVFEL